MKVCYFGSYEKNYPRNLVNIKGLRENSVEVIECHVSKPHFHIESKLSSILFFLYLPFNLIGRNIFLFFRGLYLFINKKYDVIVVGYPCHLDIFTGFLVAKIVKKPLIIDPLTSLYNIFVLERKLIKEKSISAILLLRLEVYLLSLADVVLTHSDSDKNFFHKQLLVKQKKMKTVYLGLMQRKYQTNNVNNSFFTVLYIGTYIPLHGVNTILQSAKLLVDNEDIRFRFVGTGQLRAESERYIKDHKLSNCKILGRLPEKTMVDEVTKSDLILGIFSNSLTAQNAVPNKVIQGLASKKAVVTGDTKGIREVLVDKESVYLCNPADPAALKSAILALQNDKSLFLNIAKNGYEVYLKKFTPKVIGKELLNIFYKLDE